MHILSIINELPKANELKDFSDCFMYCDVFHTNCFVIKISPTSNSEVTESNDKD